MNNPQRRTASLLCFIALPALPVLGAAPAYQGVSLYKLESPAGFLSPPSPATATGGQVAGSANPDIPGQFFFHAMLWNGPNGDVVDLHPPSVNNLGSSVAWGMSDTQQVGYARAPGSGEHAFLWSGTANSAVDLHPTNLPGFATTEAYGTDGVRQVGLGLRTNGRIDALMWSGTANSTVNLHPTNLSGFVESRAVAISGNQQVGNAHRSGQRRHAILWNGTANSAVDLHPAQYEESLALSTNGVQQVGVGDVAAGAHALLWSGTANSVVDLHPTHIAGLEYSTAVDLEGSYQVGAAWGSGTDGVHAFWWNGTADSAVDLHALLPTDFVSSSATDIDAQGNIYGIAYDSITMASYAVKWSPVPEPSTLLLSAMAALSLSWRRRNRGNDTSFLFQAAGGDSNEETTYAHHDT